MAGRRLVLRLLVLAVAWGRARGSWTCQGSCPDKDVQKLSFGGNVTITVIRAINLPNKDHFGPFSGTSDPYVEVRPRRRQPHTGRQAARQANRRKGEGQEEKRRPVGGCWPP